jgi:hypothetical protein
VLILLALVCAMLIPATHGALLEGPIQWLALLIVLSSMYVVTRSVRLYVSADLSRQEALAHEAQVNGATLVARSLRHTVGNKLAVTVGYSELLLDDPRLPEDVHEQAQLIFSSAMAAANTMHKLDPSRLDFVADASIAGPPVLKLAPSDPDTRSGAATQLDERAAPTSQPRRDADSLEGTHR